MSAKLSGLSPATTYHFRIRALNTAGETDGADETFTTSAACRGPEQDRGWEVALAHSPTAATPGSTRARKLGVAVVERDGCADYELAIAGLRSKAAATAVVARARRAGFRNAALERT